MQISTLVCWTTANHQQQKRFFTQLVTSFSLCIPQVTWFPLTVKRLINYISYNESRALVQEKNAIFSTDILIPIWLWVCIRHLQLNRSECVYSYLPKYNKHTKCNSYTSWNYGLQNRWLWCPLICFKLTPHELEYSETNNVIIALLKKLLCLTKTPNIVTYTKQVLNKCLLHLIQLYFCWKCIYLFYLGL